MIVAADVVVVVVAAAVVLVCTAAVEVVSLASQGADWQDQLASVLPGTVYARRLETAKGCNQGPIYCGLPLPSSVG